MELTYLGVIAVESFCALEGDNVCAGAGVEVDEVVVEER